MAGTKVEAPIADVAPRKAPAGKARSKARSAKGNPTVSDAVAAKPHPSKKASPVKQSKPEKQAIQATSGKPPKAAAKTEKTVKTPSSAPLESKGRQKMVRDSFTMPRGDYELIAQLKQRSLARQRVVKKSELLRAGLHALSALSDSQLISRLDVLAPIKTGRPKKG